MQNANDDFPVPLSPDNSMVFGNFPTRNAKFHPSGATRFQMLGTMRFHASGATRFQVSGAT